MIRSSLFFTEYASTYPSVGRRRARGRHDWFTDGILRREVDTEINEWHDHEYRSRPHLQSRNEEHHHQASWNVRREDECGGPACVLHA